MNVRSGNNQETTNSNNYVLEVSKENAGTDDEKSENLTYIEIDVSLVGFIYTN